MNIATAVQRKDWKKGSKKLKNPGKRFSLELAANAIRKVSLMKNSWLVLH